MPARAPLITAIIPTYKRPHLLKRSVRSVLRQTFSDFEILIADNASGDETQAVVAEFVQQDKRVKGVKREKNLGLIANFQAALMQVTTPYVCFLPDDDFFAPFYFEEAVAPFTQYPDLAFSGGGTVLIDDQYVVRTILTNHQTIPPSGFYEPPRGLLAYLRSSCGIGFPPLLFKTAILKSFGGFDLRIRNGADEHLITQCAARYPIYLITHRPFYYGYQHDGSLSRQVDFPLFEQEALCMRENLQKLPLPTEVWEEVNTFFTKRHHKILTNAYRHFCAQKEYVEAKSYADRLHTLTASSSWKRKAFQAGVYARLPYFETVYNSTKNLEKAIRNLFRQPQHPQSLPDCPPPPDAAYLADYARSLEK